MQQDAAVSDALSRLLAPRAVAVVGATETAGRPGRLVTEQLTAAGLTVYPVNPKRSAILGLPAYATVGDVPDGVDLAVVAVAAEAAVEATEACVARRLPYVVVLAGGFGEAGPDGEALQARLERAIAGSPTRLLGPNTLGLQVPASGLDTVFVEHAGTADSLDSVGIALISQSGSVAVEAVRRAAVTSFPLRAFIGLGNAADLSTVDFLPHFSAEKQTSGICLYLEHLGEGRRLLESAARASASKPVFLLKAGRTAGGAAAVSSHTGRLAGSDRVVAGALRQYGIQRVTDDEELTDAACAVSYAPLPTGNRVAVVTPAGGYGVMATDFIESAEPRALLQLAELSPHTEEQLEGVLLPFASTHNPVDLTAGVDTEGFARSVELVVGDGAVDLVIVVAFFSPAGIGDNLIPRLGEVAAATEKPIIVFTQDGPRTDTRARAFTEAGMATFTSLPRAIRAARILVERAEIQSKSGGAGYARGTRAAGGAADWIADLPDADGPSEADTKALLERYGIAVPRRLLLGGAAGEGAAGAGGAGAGGRAAGGGGAGVAGSTPRPITPPFGPPYAVKVASPRILHKTDAAALRLGVSAEELDEVVTDLADRFPGESVLIEEMVPGAEVEIIVGGLVDPDLGPAIMLGAGGIYTEIFDDVAFRLIPCTTEDIREMARELRSSPILQGYRGMQVDAEALIEALTAVSRLVVDLGPRFAELDINPMVYAGGRWVALDAKLVLKREVKDV